MSHRLTTVAAGLAGTAAVVATTVALSHPATASTSEQVIRLVGSHQSGQNIDLGRKGFSVGDLEISSARLSHAGRSIGRFDGTCQVTRLGKTADELCTQTLRMRGGEIVATGAVTSGPSGPAPYAWAITGGTGRFAAAHGYVEVRPSSGPSVHLVVHLVR
jgi:hypothetical protein